MYFPFFILHDWNKRSAEVRSTHCAVLPLKQQKNDLPKQVVLGWSRIRESNPPLWLGKRPFYQ